MVTERLTTGGIPQRGTAELSGVHQDDQLETDTLRRLQLAQLCEERHDAVVPHSGIYMIVLYYKHSRTAREKS